MIVLTKKRIVFFLGIIVVISLIFLITVETITRRNDSFESVETVALPVNNKIIILDAGHGKPDERCRK